MNPIIITNNLVEEKKIYWLYPILIWLSFFPTSLIYLFFFNFFSFWIDPIFIICFLPISLVLYYLVFILFLLLFAKLILILLNMINKPKEGIFQRNFQDKNYRYFVIRTCITRFVLKIYNYFPLPWAKILALRLFGVKISNNTGILDSFIDSDFIVIGDNVILGEGSLVMNSMILGDYLLVRKVILNRGCTIGAFSVIAPGTIVEEGAILGMGSYTYLNQRLEKNYIHFGRPAKRWKKIEDNFTFSKK